MNSKLVIAAALVGAALWLKGRAHADAKPADPKRAARARVGGASLSALLSKQGIVGSLHYNADGSVTETENNFWAGTKSVTTYSADEWSKRMAALDGGG